ncbi:uncharacterized protein DNG_07099 [Cephalotrichum gorgonifer]|uniref:Uncharacterized protein n=1 Tax=Cephalotrichum gorgonifer TaxID=2041049 RepID=A0AAE8N2P7_9PEZI|nr:uncharacterized protein DNG_07099 [Cephalotrichum gorgonifer]
MKINQYPRESSSDSSLQETNFQPKSAAKKPSLPKIIKVLRTAADWSSWIEQVNYRLISTDCRDYISLNEAGGLELTPPKSPVRPNISGPPDKRRSIDPNMGFDVTQELTFGELVEGLKAHLGVGAPPSTSTPAAARSDPEEAWENLINQNPEGASMEDWGEQIVEAHRSLKMSGFESVADWKAHMAFIVDVNQYFPTMSASLYIHLKRSAEETREDSEVTQG